MEYKDLNAKDIVRLMLSDGTITEGQAAKYFPELAEVKDEDIKRWVINEIKIKHHALDEENVDFVDKAIKWLEKQGEQKPAWSYEERIHLGNCIALTGKLSKSEANWLQSFLDRGGSEVNCTTTTEWSKEDNDMMKSIIEDVHMGADFSADVMREANEKENWLKSIRRRYISLKNTCNWEPTEEKMEALKAATYCKDQAMSKVLFELYQDLEKVIKVRHEG